MGHHIAIIGDTHFPFVDIKTLNKVLTRINGINKMSPFTHVVQVGDVYDFHAQSRFQKSFNIMTAKQEAEGGKKLAFQFWEKVNEIAPKAKKIQIKGNHDSRPMQRALDIDNGSLEPFVKIGLDSFFDFPGVEILEDSRTEYFVDDICFQHGHGGRPKQHAMFNQMSTVFGHTHRAWIHWIPLRDKMLFDFNVGYLADPQSFALAYTKQKQITNWCKGFGIIKNGVPCFFPM